MKKFILVLISLFTLLCGCEITFEKCIHDFSVETIPSTCTEEGKEIKKCKLCNEEEITTLTTVPHEFVETVESATCLTDEVTTKTCKNCTHTESSITKKALGHSFSDYVIVVNPTDLDDGLEERTCTNCKHVESRIIKSVTYTSLDVIRYNYQEKKKNGEKIIANNDEELQIIFDSLVLNNVITEDIEIMYEVEDFNGLLHSLVDNSTISKNYQINASLKDTLLTLTYTYLSKAEDISSQIMYTQLDSVNKTITEKTRSDDFTNFKINSSSYIFDVTTTDQMEYYAERRANINPTSDITKQVLDKAHEVLKTIINDQMNDFEKIKAIHDYIVLNVTYDEQLYSKALENVDLSNYRGFYIEGALIDGLAVCEGMSKAFAFLCNIEGIPCVTVDGYDVDNPNGLGHEWNKVFLDGKWYIVDVTSDGTIIGTNEVLSYKYFLISEEEMNKKYIANNHTNIICDSTYNVFETLKYTYNEVENDFKIKSSEELKHLLQYVYSLNTLPITVQFYIDYECDIINEIGQVLFELTTNTSFNYYDYNEIFMLIL